MADNALDYATWLPVIGRSLASLCLDVALKRDPNKYKEVLAKVNFLKGLGLPESDAAHAAGSTAASVQVMRSRKKSRNANGKKAGKHARGRRR
jgi:hypothetical protein